MFDAPAAIQAVSVLAGAALLLFAVSRVVGWIKAKQELKIIKERLDGHTEFLKDGERFDAADPLGDELPTLPADHRR